MVLSHITRLPELSGLDIPERLLRLRLDDGVIFRELLNEKRAVVRSGGPARRGDYVLAVVETAKGGARRIHVELGGRQFPELEAALTGAAEGGELSASVNGEEARIRVERVGRVVDMPLTDEAIAALGLPGAASLDAYRRAFIREHGEERALRVFGAVKQRLLDRLAAITQARLEPEELERFHRRQRDMIQNITGDADGRIMDAYGAATPQEGDRLLFEDNRRTFVIYLYGLALAARDGRVPSEAEREEALEHYGLIYDVDPGEIASAGLEEEAMQPFYLQYGISAVREYFLSRVSFSAVGIEDMPLRRAGAEA